MSDTSLLQVKNLSVSIDNELPILHKISLDIKPGETHVLMGPNGAGKSTLGYSLMGNPHYCVTEGNIIFDGQDITDLGITERARLGIGFAFQQPVRFKGLQVIDLLRIASGKDFSVQEACDYLSEVGLCAKDYIGREVNASLSGGELKRIEIATVLARKTRLSVFDEPEAGIDLWSFQNLIRIFEKMRREIHDSSIVIISHQERILRIADEIIVLKDGRVDQQGPADEILPKVIGTEAAVDTCTRLR